jgi:hypothetical protein
MMVGLNVRGTLGVVEHQHARDKGRGGTYTDTGDAQWLSASSSARTACVASAERRRGVDWVGLSALAQDARGGRASACERQGKGMGYLHSYHGMLSI